MVVRDGRGHLRLAQYLRFVIERPADGADPHCRSVAVAAVGAGIGKDPSPKGAAEARVRVGAAEVTDCVQIWATAHDSVGDSNREDRVVCERTLLRE